MAFRRRRVTGSSTSGDGVIVPNRRYAAYVLAVLFLVNVFNFADRAILGVVADLIQRDLHVTDTQIGFLAGTSFVVLNCIAGLAMGSIVDLWLRNRMLALAVGLWSALTAFSGLSVTFAQLAFARVGVGLGEAVGGPVSHSLLADIFPPRSRAKAFAVFFCAPSVGTVLCLTVSGWIVHNWPHHCAAFGACGVASWKIPFLVFGAPGVLLAIAAWMIRDPAAGAAAQARREARPLAAVMGELVLLVPPLPPLALLRVGAGAVRANLIIAAVIILVAIMLMVLTGDRAQWIATGIAFYALASWCQSAQRRDPAFFRLTIGSPTFVATILGAAIIGTCSGAIGFWAVPYAIRTLHLDHATVGSLLGVAIGGGSITGTFLGGLAADRWRRTNVAAPLFIAMISMVTSAAAMAWLLLATTPVSYAIALAIFMVATTLWAPPIASLVQDLVLSSMRGRAASIYTVVLTLIAMSAGPYAVGRIADASGSLRLGMLAPFAAAPVSLLLLAYAVRGLKRAYVARDAAASVIAA